MPNPCPYCGDHMTSVNRKQCGKPDCKRLYRNEKQREFQQQYRAVHGTRYATDRHGESQRNTDRKRRQGQPHWRQRYPSAAASIDARRRARKEQAATAESFAPLEVHTRDGWTCRLCRLPIDPEVAWPDPMSASVDHIVPLSRGGQHSMINVQSAHLGCNSSKGDRLVGKADAAIERSSL